MVTGALLSLTSLDAETSLASAGWRLVLLGLGMGFVVTPMTATAVASVPHHLAGMASAGNNAFRQLGGALGPAVLGTLLTSRAEHTLPAHLADAGVLGTVRQHTVAAVEAEGLGAVARLDLGADTGRALAAAGDAFLDGLRLCLIVAAVLTLLAAAVSALLLGRQRQNGAASVRVTTPTSGAATPIGVVTAPDVAAIGQGDGGS